MFVKSALLLAASLQFASDSGVSEGGSGRGSLGRPAGEKEVYVGFRGELEVPAPQSASFAVKIDGYLDDEAWSGGALLDGFTQFDPAEGIPATQDTRVRVLVTDDAILFGIRADDSERGGVRATLTPRDGFGRSDDYVRIVLDTFNDQRRAFVFQVNPLGVQGDGLWVGGGRSPVDWNPDFLWESAGRIDEGGYSVEVKIPLNSLRFPEAEVQDWGLQIVRRIQRSGFEESWAPISGESANALAQSGKLKGLRGLTPGSFLELNPVVTATQQGTWDPARGGLNRSAAAGDFGINAAYGITSNLTLDATYNPDFSQVEADAGQIVVNERFALYFPEKRPFFLEGTDVFSMPRQLVYTRSIGNPIGAAKLSGKVGSFNVAYIGAVDAAGTDTRNPVINLLRIRRDVGQAGSTVGLVYTDRSVFGESFNRVVGADARLVLAGRYSVELLASGSSDGASGRSTEWGSLFVANVRRSSRSLSFSASFEDVSDRFRAGSGFIRRTGVTRLQARTGYTWRGEPGALLESWGPSLEVQGYWDRGDFWAGSGPEESELQMNLSFSLRGNIGGVVSLARDSYLFGAQDYEGLFVRPSPAAEPSPFAPDASVFGGLWGMSARGWISRWEWTRLSFGGSWGEAPIFTSGVAADVAHRRSGDVSLTLYPTGSLSATVGLRHVELHRQRDGSLYSRATIPRIQARYQFNRALFLRGTGEYSSQTRGDIMDPESGAVVLRCGDTCVARSGSDSHDFRVEGLLGYEPSPGTVVYVGYSRQMQDAEAFGFRTFTPRNEGLFVKLSYRFRM